MEKILKLIPKVDISTPTKVKKFKAWQNNDGTLQGLKKLIKCQIKACKK